MATVLLASCPVHGDIAVDATSVLMLVSPVPGRSRLRLPCASCGGPVTQIITPRQVRHLRAHQVPLQVMTEPDEKPPACAVVPMSADDVLDALLAMRESADLVALARGAE